MAKILDRKDEHRVKEIDKDVKNRFRWNWLEKEVTVRVGTKDLKVTLAEFIRKVDVKGKVLCILCNDLINYASRGCKTIENHALTKKHIEKIRLKQNNYSLSSAFLPSSSNEASPSTYGLHPTLTVGASRPEAVKPLISLGDRVTNAEATVLGVLAENSLPLTMAPVLVNMAKELSRDPKALNHLSMDRTTASYKMTYGLAETFKQTTLDHIRTQPFSLNIDESTSNNLKRVLAVLVSYFSEKTGKVVVEHLASVSVTKVDAKSLYEELNSLFSQNKIPWENLVSILMDSCSVMRGSKSGLETRIRNGKANHLLDIDGDTCHHIHNATRVLCKPFDGYLEKFYMDIANDFKWSVDLTEKLQCICELLGLKFTMPERFIGHRWLSMYDVSISNNRLYDAYFVFYYSFLSKEDKKLYKSVLMDVYLSRKASTECVQKIGEIQKDLGSKSLTSDGKERKNRIITKLIYQRKTTQLYMNFFMAALPTMKSYVCLFESKEPLVHKLLDKQEELFRELLSLFLKPQHFEDKFGQTLCEINVKNQEIQLNMNTVFYGSANEKIIKRSHKDDQVVIDFKKKVIQGYQNCAEYLQGKLPLDSELLKAISAVDPTARSHSVTLKQLKKLPDMVTNILSEEETAMYVKEVHLYCEDNNLPCCLTEDGAEIRVDAWWHRVSSLKRYPAMSKLIKGVLTCFHGPQVEGSFNTMGDILDVKSCRTNISTYSSYQTVKYALRAEASTSLSYFHREDFLHQPVSRQLCYNMRSARSKYSEVLKRKKEEQIKREEEMKISKERKQSKKAARAVIELAEKKAKLAHRRKRKARLAKLQLLADKVKQKRSKPNQPHDEKDRPCERKRKNSSAECDLDHITKSRKLN